MKSAAELRRTNLEVLVQEKGTLAAVAQAAGTSSVYLSQIRSGTIDLKTNQPRSMGAEMARRLETGCGKPVGWMDHEHHLVEEALRGMHDDEFDGVIEQHQEMVLTDEVILAIRDRHLPSQGESFDTLAFGRDVALEALKDATFRANRAVEVLDASIRSAIAEAKGAGLPQGVIVRLLQSFVHAQPASRQDGT